VLFHTDAVQGIGKVPFDVEAMNVDLASITAHKMYGPKGVGALYVRRSKPRVRLTAQMDGGGHEFGMRSGTLNVPGIVGFGKAAEIMKDSRASRSRSASSRSASAPRGLCRRASTRSRSTARPTHRLPGNLNVSFAFVEGEAMMMAIKDVAVLERLGLHEREPRALVRAARDGHRRRPRPLVDPLRPRPLHHGGGGRLRGQLVTARR
jgi:cysteine desulfurase